MKTGLHLIASLFLVSSAVAGEDCKITDVKTSSLDAKAIGLTAESAKGSAKTVWPYRTMRPYRMIFSTMGNI